MIFNKNMLIEIGNSKIAKTEKYFLNKKRKEGGDMLNRNLYLMLYDEEVYIKKFNFPKAKGELLYNLVKNELTFSVGNINNILFDYRVTKCENLCVEVIVFYINSQKLTFIKENNCYKNIKKISLIQFAIKKYYEKNIKEKDYMMAFVYDKGLYILAVNENNLVANSIIDNFSCEEDELIKAITSFKIKFSQQFLNIKNIYLASMGIEFNNHKNYILQDIVIKSLEKYKKEKLVESFL